MSDDIEYTTVEQQIEKLKEHNLIIGDESSAKRVLTLFGYSDLIKSYREPYVINSDNRKIYRSGVTFEQIYSLYTFDKNIRNAVMATMLDLEEHIKEIAADVIGNSFGVHQDQYLQYRNYQNRRKRKARFMLSGILDKLKSTLNTDKNPIYHYQTEHGIVPPWILFKSVYFTTIVNFIDLFKSTELDVMAERLYGGKNLNISSESLRKLMMDTLFICIEYRNVAAHGGRMYNYSCQSNLRTNEIFGDQIGGDLSGFSQLLFLLNLLDYDHPFNYLNSTLEHEVNRHCSQFPQDITYLGQVLNIDIEPRNSVYITKKSNKYHANPHCSGINVVSELDLLEAEKRGFIPCQRCAKNIIPIA